MWIEKKISLLSEGELREVIGEAAVLICRGASGFSGRWVLLEEPSAWSYVGSRADELAAAAKEEHTT